MATKKAPTDETTEEKIKAAARKVFTKKGFSAARTRDIAEEAGINLALLNYYFRSKEKLFDIVMMENLQQFLLGLKSVLHDEKSSLTEKVAVIAEEYINMLKANPDLPVFVLTEIRTNPEKLADTMKVKTLLLESAFFKQLLAATKGKMHPMHLLINIMGLTVFPFVAGPLLQHVGSLKTEDFHKLMDERKKMIPMWFDSILKGI
ncbi:MAG TPA: TetR/AcrR family transcriptional regulator [Cyclobacteriaceae bacterium]|nr:TetR/AcrR family transcriptional regulator [Cyclobacteriaceae bacterium]